MTLCLCGTAIPHKSTVQIPNEISGSYGGKYKVDCLSGCLVLKSRTKWQSLLPVSRPDDELSKQFRNVDQFLRCYITEDSDFHPPHDIWPNMDLWKHDTDGRKQEELAQNLTDVTFNPQQISHRLSWERIRGCTVRSQRLTASAIGRSFLYLNPPVKYLSQHFCRYLNWNFAWLGFLKFVKSREFLELSIRFLFLETNPITVLKCGVMEMSRMLWSVGKLTETSTQRVGIHPAKSALTRQNNICFRYHRYTNLSRVHMSEIGDRTVLFSQGFHFHIVIRQLFSRSLGFQCQVLHAPLLL